MKKNRSITTLTAAFAFVAVFTLKAPVAFAAGAHGGSHGKTLSTGTVGKASDITRTVNVVMNDNYYDIEKFSLKGGETIRFAIRNAGEFVHEFNIGTKAMHAGHAKEMMMMMEHGLLEADKINQDKREMVMSNGQTMQHNDPNSVLLEPGKSAEIIWKFPTKAPAQFEFACNIPGHYEAGMVVKVHFQKPLS